MSATVPEHRLVVEQSDGGGLVTAATRSVAARPWIQAAHNHCWLAGRGSMDVPVHAPFVTVPAGMISTFRYWTKPRYQTCRYAYSFILTAASAGTATVAIPSGGTTYSVPVRPAYLAADGVRGGPTTIFVDRASKSSSEAELSFDVIAPASIDVRVESVSIEAVPRTVLIEADDLGVDRILFWPRSPIYVGNIANELLARQNDLRNACRRNGFMFSRGTLNPWTFTGGATSLFDDTISVTGRYLFNGDTTRTMRCRILAQCSDDETAGEFKLNNAISAELGTDALSIEIPAGTTSWTWLPQNPASATFLVKAEDNTTWNGFRSGSADEHSFTGERTEGTGTVRIASVCIYDAAD